MTSGLEGQSKLARAIYERLGRAIDLAGGQRAVIAIAGESGSGKTEIALGLLRVLGASALDAIVFHQDDYFLRPPSANHAYREAHVSSVGPQEVNLDLLARHVRAFRDREQSVTVPRVDYPSDAFRTTRLNLSDVAVLIVEGTYVFGLPEIDFRIFLDATHEDTRERRRMRARDAESEFVEKVLVLEHHLIAPQRSLADIVIDRSFNISSDRQST